ncbi:Synaptotagmin 7 [Carabus blaptoides fortunei]
MEDFWSKKLRSYKQSFHNEDSETLPGIVPTLEIERKNILTLPDIIAEQATQEHEDYEVMYPIVAAVAGLLILLTLTVIFVASRRRHKRGDEENKAASILVYPSQQGPIPQFLSKEIHFSLPPLRSSSLSDLVNGEQEDSDIEISESLLIPTAHNKRSNSFSCYGLGVIEPALYKSTLELDDFQWPEGHLGRIWFSLRYEPSTEKLLVSLLKAKNLPSRTVGTVNSCDPFVRLHLLPDERRHLQSRQKKKTCNPYFDETLVFQVSAKNMMDHILKLTVIDGGRTKRRAELGHVTFPLRDLELGDNSEQKLFKMDLEKEAQEHISDLGELLVSLFYNENLKRLTATVIEARRLKYQGEKRDTYVKVSMNQQYRVVKEKKTAMSRPSGDGTVTFAEGFNLRLPPTQVDITSVAFHVYQLTAGYGRDKLIGKCVLGSYMFARGKALSHWNSVIASPMEQIQHWHILCE